MLERLNFRESDFISLTDVVIEPLDNSSTQQHAFTAVRRKRIVFASELDQL